LITRSRVQIQRIALYWAISTIVLSILWSFALNMFRASGALAGSTFALPIIVGTVFSVLYYFWRVHKTIEYDERGLSIRKGRKGLDEYTWSEFAECSVVNEGRAKVRLYREKDGAHIDIDASDCGIEPYRFRDYAASCITGVPVKEEAPGILDKLEMEIPKRAYWLADLGETFRNYQVSGIFFPLFARGSTRPKGFFLSRFVAVTIMPNYNVCMYVDRLSNREDNVKNKILRNVRAIESQRDRKNIKWSWLLMLGDQEPEESVAQFIQEFGNKDVGLGYLNTLNGSFITSANQLGRSMKGQMRFGRVISDLRKRKYHG
jgi:hypothetical protein